MEKEKKVGGGGKEGRKKESILHASMLSGRGIFPVINGGSCGAL